VEAIPERTRGFYVRHTFVCPDSECSHPNDNDVLVFAENEEQARQKVILICSGCKKPVVTSYVVLEIREAPPAESAREFE
jgi:hypothetical protein